MTSSPAPRRRRLYAELATIGLGGALVAMASWYLMNLKCNAEALVCENQSVTEYPSPTKAKKFVLFLRNCGATVAYHTYGSILDAGQPLPDAPGNVFGLPGAHVPRAGQDAGAADIAVVWVSEAEVRVVHAAGVNMAGEKSDVGGTRISYQPRP